jgi:ribonuclease G
VYRALQEALRSDKARTNILKISELGLVEMTRKRTRENLVQTLCEPCAHCEGRGYLLSGESVAYKILREVRTDLPRFSGRRIAITVNPRVAELLLGVENKPLQVLSKDLGREIEVRARPSLHQEQFEVEALDSGPPVVIPLRWLRDPSEIAAEEEAKAKEKAEAKKAAKATRSRSGRRRGRGKRDDADSEDAEDSEDASSEASEAGGEDAAAESESPAAAAAEAGPVSSSEAETEATADGDATPPAEPESAAAVPVAPNAATPVVAQASQSAEPTPDAVPPEGDGSPGAATDPADGAIDGAGGAPPLARSEPPAVAPAPAPLAASAVEASERDLVAASEDPQPVDDEAEKRILPRSEGDEDKSCTP